MGSQLFLFQISALLLIPLRALKSFSLEPASGSGEPKLPPLTTLDSLRSWAGKASVFRAESWVA